VFSGQTSPLVAAGGPGLRRADSACASVPAHGECPAQSIVRQAGAHRRRRPWDGRRPGRGRARAAATRWRGRLRGAGSTARPGGAGERARRWTVGPATAAPRGRARHPAGAGALSGTDAYSVCSTDATVAGTRGNAPAGGAACCAGPGGSACLRPGAPACAATAGPGAGGSACTCPAGPGTRGPARLGPGALARTGDFAPAGGSACACGRHSARAGRGRARAARGRWEGHPQTANASRDASEAGAPLTRARAGAGSARGGRAPAATKPVYCARTDRGRPSERVGSGAAG
jgi:hypothetical protein